MRNLLLRTTFLPFLFLSLIFFLVFLTGIKVLLKGNDLESKNGGIMNLFGFKTKNGGNLSNNVNIVRKKNRKIVLVVGVLTKLSMLGRRDVIRFTWFRQCKQNPDIVQCNFFTDTSSNTTEMSFYERENDAHGDILFMPIKGGHKFSERLLWMLKWYTSNYEFDYFLRVDDDYFLCMNRLLMELPYRPKNGLYWGYTHCTDNVVRVDEGWMILSRDIITEVLSKYNRTLLCHPFGDQAVALWIQDSKLDVTWFPDNRRIVHKATAFNSKKYLVENLCDKYLALHGAYRVEMLKYWIYSKSETSPLTLGDYRTNKNNLRYEIPRIPRLIDVCLNKNLTFSVNAFYPELRFQPKLCKENPTWSITGVNFVGREQIGHDTILLD